MGYGSGVKAALRLAMILAGLIAATAAWAVRLDPSLGADLHGASASVPDGDPRDPGPAAAPAPAAQAAQRLALTRLSETWAAEDARRSADRAALLARYDDTPVPDTPSGAETSSTPPDPDARYRQARDDLARLLAEANAALQDLAAPSQVPPPGPDPALAAETRRMRVLEQTRRWSEAEASMGALRRVQADQVRLLSAASPALQAQATGFTRGGLARMAAELQDLKLMSHWYPLQRLHTARSAPDRLHDAFDAGVLGLGALGAALLLAGYLFVRVRHRRWLAALRERALGAVEDDDLALRVDRAFLLVGALSSELLLLVAVYLLFEHVLAAFRGVAEIALLRQLCYAYAIYALAVAAMHRVLLNAVTRYRVVEPTLNRKMHDSLRLVARLALGIAIYLIVAQALLGRGALYGIAVGLAWIGALAVAWRLLSTWHAEIVSAYLRLYPQGGLASQVRETADRASGLPVALAAFGFVAARGLVSWLRDTALSFEQTRKALAFLLRRRLEKQAEGQTRLAPDPSKLPPELGAALTEDPAPDGLTVNVFPSLWELVAWAESLAGGGTGAVVALSGQRGAGKTSWLEALQRRAVTKLPCLLHAFVDRQWESAVVLEQLARVLGYPGAADAEALIASLAGGPRRVVLLDVCQNLMLRAVGGLDGYRLLLRIARETSTRVLWVLAFSRWPFEFLCRTHPDQDVYDRIVSLDGWTERDIGRLIEVRMAAAGYQADYSQLLLRAAPLSAHDGGSRHAVEAMAARGLEAERISDRYHRVIWDYADGNPRVALHFWRNSLMPAEGRTVTVRLFAMPSIHMLELLGAHTRFLLAALVVHENITAAEAARALRHPASTCATQLRSMEVQGLLESQDGRYRVSCHWNRAVLRFLQRKNLLIA